MSTKICVSNPLANPYYILGIFERGTNRRYCIECKAMLPIDNFAPGREQNIQRFICREHPVECKQIKQRAKDQCVVEPGFESEGRPQKATRAVVSLRKRAKGDLKTFEQAVLRLSVRQIERLLRPEHFDDHARFALLPRRPNEPVSPDNVVVVTVPQRRYLTGLWRLKHDPILYERDLGMLLSCEDAP